MTIRLRSVSSAMSSGTLHGRIAPATRSHSASKWLRSRETSHFAATFRRASACLTQYSPRDDTTFQMSEETPPGRGSNVSVSLASANPSLARKRPTEASKSGSRPGNSGLFFIIAHGRQTPLPRAAAQRRWRG